MKLIRKAKEICSKKQRILIFFHRSSICLHDDNMLVYDLNKGLIHDNKSNRIRCLQKCQVISFIYQLPSTYCPPNVTSSAAYKGCIHLEKIMKHASTYLQEELFWPAELNSRIDLIVFSHFLFCLDSLLLHLFYFIIFFT